MVFTDAELDDLRSGRLGRLATLTPDGTLPNSPVGRAEQAAGSSAEQPGAEGPR